MNQLPSIPEVEAARETLKQFKAAQRRAAIEAKRTEQPKRNRSIADQEIWTLMLHLPAELKPVLTELKAAKRTTFVSLVTEALTRMVAEEQANRAFGVEN